MNIVYALILLAAALPASYLCLLALAAVRARTTRPSRQPRHRFAIAIPAHNEETVNRNSPFTILWSLLLLILFLYPLLGLALERAPLKAYLAILAGLFFSVWRTWLAFTSRPGRRRIEWVRTPRKVDRETG